MDDIDSAPCPNVSVSGMQLQKKIVNPACPPREDRPKSPDVRPCRIGAAPPRLSVLSG